MYFDFDDLGVDCGKRYGATTGSPSVIFSYILARLYTESPTLVSLLKPLRTRTVVKRDEVVYEAEGVSTWCVHIQIVVEEVGS